VAQSVGVEELQGLPDAETDYQDSDECSKIFDHGPLTIDH
jgi:hypothetical protein